MGITSKTDGSYSTDCRATSEGRGEDSNGNAPEALGSVWHVVRLPTVPNYHHCHYYHCSDVIGAIIEGCTDITQAQRRMCKVPRQECTGSESAENDVFSSAGDVTKGPKCHSLAGS